LLVCYIISVSATLTVQVEPRASECFNTVAEAGQLVQVNFFVTRGGLLDIDLRITAPNKEVIYSGLQFEGSQYSFTASMSGLHEVCWNNEMSRWTAKVVQFDVTVGEEPDDESNYITHSSLNPMEDSISRLEHLLDNIQRDQFYLRVREQRHRDTAESTNGRVLYYSIFESFVLISISLGQVYYLRKVFETKRPM